MMNLEEQINSGGEELGGEVYEVRSEHAAIEHLHRRVVGSPNSSIVQGAWYAFRENLEAFKNGKPMQTTFNGHSFVPIS